MNHSQALGNRTPRYAWWKTTALLLALLAASLPFAARALVGPPGARVHVRWQPTIDETTRERLEARFRLEDRERLDEQTWRYDLTDPSTDNIRALVGDPAVGDTHDIDRSSYSVDPAAVRTARRQRFPAGGDAAVLAADTLAMMLAVAAALLVAIGIAGRAPTPHAVPPLVTTTLRRVSGAVRAAAAPVARFLQRGIPERDATTAGAFRIVFGLAVLAFFATHRVDASMLDRTFDININGELHAAVLEWLRSRRYFVDLVTPWLFTTGVLFTAGVFTRFTYGLFVAGVILWAYVAVYADSTHPHSTLVLTLVALLPSRWGDGLSVDVWRRRAPFGPAGKHYGYSVWVPSLVFGVAFAAAAFAKLRGGTNWILDGAVKYHFITDSIAAPVDWGLQFVNYPRLAIVASLAAVATEALVITAAFVRSGLYRLALGIAALALLAGFRLFMGVFWAGWWILLLGFVPWRRVSMGRLKPAPTNDQYVEAGFSRPARHVSAMQLALIVAILAQQIVISTLVIERAPMFTHYPMYSATWANLDQFNASRPPVYRVVVSTDRGRLELRCSPSERLVTEFRQALDGSATAAASVRRQLEGCGENLADARQVVFEGYWRRFDRERLEFTSTPTAGILGPLALDEEPAKGSGP